MAVAVAGRGCGGYIFVLASHVRHVGGRLLRKNLTYMNTLANRGVLRGTC